MQATFDVRLQGASNVLVDRQEIEPFRIEMPATPMLGFLVLGMLRIADDVQKLLISRDTADIFGRPGTSTVDAGRVLGNGIEEDHLLNFDRMMPVVAEIINVGELYPSAAEIAKANLTFVEDPRIAFDRAFFGDRSVAIAEPSDMEFVEMIVPPTERRLDRQVKLLKIPCARHDQASPDSRLDLVDGYQELNGVGRFEHGTEQTENASRRQALRFQIP